MLYEQIRTTEPKGRCEYPSAVCTNRIDPEARQHRMCRNHLHLIWSVVDEGQAPIRQRMSEWEERRKAQAEAADREFRDRLRGERATHPGTIYYLRVGSEYKIGWTSDLDSRLKQYPPTAEVLATEPGTRVDELKLHRRFRLHRIAGREWYRRAGAITRHIKAVAEAHGAWDPRAPIRLNPTTPQERQAESLRWIGKGTGPAA